MKFSKALDETKISKLIQLAKHNDPRAKNSSMVGNITDDQGNDLTYERAKKLLQSNNVNIDQALETVLQNGTQSSMAKEVDAQKAKDELEKKREQRSRMKGGSVVKSRYGISPT